jgi:hypothetical protein
MLSSSSIFFNNEQEHCSFGKCFPCVGVALVHCSFFNNDQRRLVDLDDQIRLPQQQAHVVTSGWHRLLPTLFTLIPDRNKAIRVSAVSLAGFCYPTLAYITSAFFLYLIHYGSSNRLQFSGYRLSASAFSLTVSTIILDLIISEFNLWTTNLRKQSNFIRFKILELYKKLENRNYIID